MVIRRCFTVLSTVLLAGRWRCSPSSGRRYFRWSLFRISFIVSHKDETIKHKWKKRTEMLLKRKMSVLTATRHTTTTCFKHHRLTRKSVCICLFQKVFHAVFCSLSTLRSWQHVILSSTPFVCIH